MRKTFPSRGRGRSDVLAALEAMKQGDADWQGGRVPLFVFKGSDEATDIAQAAFNLYYAENALGRHRAFPSLNQMEQDIVDMALDLFQAPVGATGFVTTGGTESIIQAIQTCRDYNRVKRADPAHRGNIVAAVSVHPAFDKGARLMDLEVRRLPVAADFRADPGAIEAAIDDDTIMIVGSAPCFPFGVFDPVEDLADLARRTGLWLHVDACVGGYLAPFVAANGGRVPAFDFAVDGVMSLSADLHKFGFAPKPISTVFYRSHDHSQHHGFAFNDWPNGRFATTTIVGTRAGGAIAGAWALFEHLGRDGYGAIADKLMAGIEAYRAGIGAIDGLHVLGDPELSIVAYGSDRFDIYRVAELLEAKGWTPGLLQQPKAIHRMMSMLHVAVMDDYLQDLTTVAAEVAAGAAGEAQLAAEY